jgi:serine/threonine protein kinase
MSARSADDSLDCWLRRLTAKLMRNKPSSRRQRPAEPARGGETGVNQGYDAFCMVDPLFYDTINSERTAGTSFATADRPLPASWQRKPQEDWLVFDPGDVKLPNQGWKIHAAACLDNADRVLDAVWDYCVPRGIKFKFLRSKAALMGRVTKYAPRGYSGKLVTIYPTDDGQCETILRELGEILDGEPSPYILTDLRWGAGPLYVRYGAFVMRNCVAANGRVVPAIADETGTLIPDRRDPTFHVPPWVTLPDFLAPHLAARNSVTLADLPYTVERVLHFSNGGGVYVGTDTRTGEQIVLKEGRPHSGIDGRGADAVRRVELEHETLTRLAGIPGIPAAHDLFWIGEHRFLAMEFIDGLPLNKAIVRRYPMIDPAAGPAEFAEYAEWALRVHEQVERTVAAINERGIVYGDLHLYNVMVRDDGTTGLLDFEVAAPAETATRPGLGNPGFSSPRGTTGTDIDRYALACLRLAIFLPMTDVFSLDRDKAAHFAEIIAEHFPVPPEYLDEALAVILPDPSVRRPGPHVAPDSAGWPDLRASLARAIVASATPDRDDRLFPGDIRQFTLGGLGLGYGAAGVLYALDVTGTGRYPQFERWLIERATNPPTGTVPGLYDGLHGVAFTLDHLGHRQEALDVLDICLRENWQSLGLGLTGGLAGIGLNFLHFAERTGEPLFSEAARRAIELVAERLGDEESVAEISGGEHPYAGLLQGSSGPALLLIRAYDETGDTGYLDLAAVALGQDLRRCVTRENGVLEVNEGWRTMPYLDTGSVGVGLVLDEYLARRHDDRFAEASRGAQFAAQSPMYVLPGLFEGRAGILLYLANRSLDPATDPHVAKQVRGLAWQAMPYADGLAYPGTGLRRLSMDLGTGNAGILLALGAALHDAPVHAPLLAPIRPRLIAAPQSPAPTGAGALTL